MKITIETADNGYILSDADSNVQVYQESDQRDTDIDLDMLMSLTYALWEKLGYYGSKHHSERLFVRKEKQKPCT